MTPQSNQPKSPFERSYAPSIEELSVSFENTGITFIELIETGQTGAVYKAKQERLDRVVAVKILPRRHSADSIYAESFKKDAKQIAKINHPGLVKVFDSGVADNHLYLIQEYVEGVSVQQHIQRERFTELQAVILACSVSEALIPAHDIRLYHHAICARNVMMTQANEIKLIGLKIGSYSSSVSGVSNMEDMRYLSPESLKDVNLVDQRSDIYSIGVLMLKSLTGMCPREFIKAGQPGRNDISNVISIIYNCIRTNPDQRYQSVSHLSQDLRAQYELLMTQGQVLQPA